MRNSGVRATEVVVLHPRLQLSRPDVLAGVSIDVGPFAQKRLDEALSLAVGTLGVGPRALVLDAKAVEELGEAPGLVGRCVVGHDGLDGHTELAVIAQRCDQEVADTAAGLIAQRLAEADAGVIVNGHMQCLPARVKRVARAISRHAMPGLIEAAELLHVHVQQLAGAPFLIAAHGHAVLHRGQFGQAGLHAYAPHSALGDAHNLGDLLVAQR